MTVEELEKYRTLKRQIDIMESDAGISYISGVDTTKPSVQSGKISNPTESVGLKLYEMDCELKSFYKLTKDRLRTITKYIAHIKDDEVREIAMLRCFDGQEYEQIGKAMNYDRTTVSKKLRRYVSHNSH